MRYELSDSEWSVIDADAPQQAARRASCRRSARSQWHLLGVAIGCTLAGSSGYLRSSDHLLQSVRPLASGRHLGEHHERAGRAT